MVDNIGHTYDTTNVGVESIVIKAISIDDYNIKQSITYGTILRAHITSEEETDTVMLIDNSSSGNGVDCLVVDLGTKEVLLDCVNIDEFINRYEIKEVVGDFDELFKVCST